MENPPSPNPLVPDITAQKESSTPPPVATEVSKKKLPVFLALSLMFIFLTTAAIITWRNLPRPSSTSTGPAPTRPAATPTPARALTTLATASAFISFEQAVASLSASLDKINLNDPSLSPPVVELSLGFSD